jgi:hypothetical protein
LHRLLDILRLSVGARSPEQFERCEALLRSQSRRAFPINDVSDDSPRSFGKCDVVGEAALKQCAYAIVTGRISGDTQCHALTNA